MKHVNIHQAKTDLSKLLVRVARGEEVVIAKAGKPVAKLVGLKVGGARKPGLVPGLKLGAEFWHPLSDAELSEWGK